MRFGADWDRWEPQFAEAMDQRLYTPEWLKATVEGGRAQFWSSDKAAIVSELRFYPTGAVDLHGIVAAGDVDEIVGVLIPAAEEWAKKAGCLGAIIESRPAWRRLLATSGYEPHQLALRKEL